MRKKMPIQLNLTRLSRNLKKKSKWVKKEYYAFACAHVCCPLSSMSMCHTGSKSYYYQTISQVHVAYSMHWAVCRHAGRSQRCWFPQRAQVYLQCPLTVQEITSCDLSFCNYFEHTLSLYKYGFLQLIFLDSLLV